MCAQAPLTLTMEGPLVALGTGNDGSREPIVEPSGLEVYIRQDYRESEPHLKVSLQTSLDAVLDVRLTLAEGRQFAEILLAAARRAENGPLAG